MEWLGDLLLLPKPQPLPHGQQGAKPTPTGAGEAPLGDAMGTQLPGATAKPFKQLHKNQTDLLCLKLTGSDRVLPGGAEKRRDGAKGHCSKQGQAKAPLPHRCS